jgi:cardiolipin synthase A/B
MTAKTLAGRPPRPRSKPSPWHYHRAERRPHQRTVVGRRKGAPTWWTQVRRALWAWWPWAAVAAGLEYREEREWALVVALVAVICYLIAPKAEPPRFGLEHEFSVNAETFLPTIAGTANAPLIPGNRLELLNNGDAFYPRMLDDIARAEYSITIEAYIYWAGEVGLQFARALADKARQGVTVTILLDSIGSANIGREILTTLEPACRVAWFNPIHWYTIGRFNNRTHRKSLIIDGVVGYTGGAGIADHWRGNAEGPQSWRDMQVRIEGPGVVPLQSGFAHNWLATTGEVVSGELYFPRVPVRGDLSIQTLLSSPETGGSNVRTMYYLSIACARRSIYIANPYFVPDTVALETLIDAQKRGVDVRIMVSGARNDNWLARHNSIRLYGPLLEAGITLLEFNRTMLHHKTMVVDAVWATIGTTNFDNRSFAHNEESNICCLDRNIAAALHQTFLADTSNCARVTLDEWKRRGAWSKLQESLASLLQEQA